METRRSLRNLQILSQGGTPSLTLSLLMPKVLLAEDKPDMRHLIAKWLREMGCEVVEFQDGETLWREIADWQADDDNARDPDLIITDIRMPGSSGLEVLSRLRLTNSWTPVILMTAFADDETVANAAKFGAARVFSKPFDIAELVATALRLVDRN